MSIKTSQSHPLRINAVKAGNGEIGLTFCPGKKQTNSFSSPWDRNLDVDLLAIKDWRTEALVTLIEGHEFQEMRVPDLGERSEAIGLEWHHLPIKDVSIPDEAFERAWTYSGHRLRSLLQSGKKVVIHCKGGLGRTGTIAGWLKIELGDNADDAIKAIREARPGSIETREQEEYVHRQSAVGDGVDFADRVLGCLLGGAVGDAFGYGVKFQSLASIRSTFGEKGSTKPVFHDGNLIVSDDTQMTMFTLEGLLRATSFDEERAVEELRLAYLDWHSTQSTPISEWSPAGSIWQDERLRIGRAPGNTCLSALRAGGTGTPDSRINNSKGCGGIMRVAPIGLIRQWPPEKVFGVAARAAAITHGHPSGFWSAAAMAAIVRMMLGGEELEDAAEQSLKMLANKPDNEETTYAISMALDAYRSASSDDIGNVGRLGEGWVGEEALAVAMYAALAGNSFAEVLAIGANHDGDSDSTASIAGQLYGAGKGLSDLPHAWTRRLDVFDPVISLTNGLLRLL